MEYTGKFELTINRFLKKGYEKKRHIEGPF